MSLLLTIIFGIVIGYFVLIFVLNKLNLVVNIFVYIFGLGFFLIIGLIILYVILEWYDYIMNENFKDGLSSLIIFVGLTLCLLSSFNDYSFLTFKKYEINKKPYLLTISEIIIVMSIYVSLTILL